MHKDLSEGARIVATGKLANCVNELVTWLNQQDQSLAIAREALIDALPEAFDKAAAELD